MGRGRERRGRHHRCATAGFVATTARRRDASQGQSCNGTSKTHSPTNKGRAGLSLHCGGMAACSLKLWRLTHTVSGHAARAHVRCFGLTGWADKRAAAWPLGRAGTAPAPQVGLSVPRAPGKFWVAVNFFFLSLALGVLRTAPHFVSANRLHVPAELWRMWSSRTEGDGAKRSNQPCHALLCSGFTVQGSSYGAAAKLDALHKS